MAQTGQTGLANLDPTSGLGQLQDLSITDEEKELMRLAAQAKIEGAKGRLFWLGWAVWLILRASG